MKPLALARQRWLASCTAHVRRAIRRDTVPAPGAVDFGALRELQTAQNHPPAVDFNWYYAKQFFGRELRFVNGAALEISTDERRISAACTPKRANFSSLRFAGEPELLRDLTTFEESTFQVVVLRSVLQFIYDLDALLAQLKRTLASGGLLLATVPGTCYTPAPSREYPAYWGFTDLCARKLLGAHFPVHSVTIETFGNVLVAMAHAYGAGAEELTKRELEHRDPNYPFVLGLRARNVQLSAQAQSTGATA